MLTSIATIALTFMAAHICLMLNKINSDNRYIRLSIDEMESTVNSRQWVVYSNKSAAP
jgi:hypothetical protein